MINFEKSFKWIHFILFLSIVTAILSIIEACHIRPHAQSGIDSITNGIPLCAHLHRAFDRGLLSIGKDYRVLVKGQREFKESDSPLKITQFRKKKILLPGTERYYPAQEHLAWHRNAFGF